MTSSTVALAALTRRSIGARGTISPAASSAQRSPKVFLKSSTTNSGRPASAQAGAPSSVRLMRLRSCFDSGLGP